MKNEKYQSQTDVLVCSVVMILELLWLVVRKVPSQEGSNRRSSVKDNVVQTCSAHVITLSVNVHANIHI